MNTPIRGMLTQTFSTIAGYPSLPLNARKIIEIVQAMRSDHVSYGLGAKVKDYTASPPSFIMPDGSPCNALDCSAFFRYAVYHSSGGRVMLPDGSVNQHDAIQAAGFKTTDPANCALKDGHVRVLFLSPGYEGVGHVCCFPGDGLSAESHGGRGPDRRPWTGQGWQAQHDYLTCYVLA